jgi:transposase-like protein
MNPFRVKRETEKLLVVREREREFRDYNKIEKESLRVFEKTIATRQNRSGVIREINAIRPTAN